LALEQVSANRYVTMVIYQKLLPRTKKRGVFYFSLKISSLNRLASYDEYPPDRGKGSESESCPFVTLASNNTFTRSLLISFMHTHTHFYSQCRRSHNTHYALCVGHQVLRGHQKIG